MRLLFTFLSFIVCCAVSAQQTFRIHGKVKGLKAGVEIGLLSSEDMSSEEIATATVQKNGEFFLEGHVDHPMLCTLTTNNLALLGDKAEKNDYKDVKWTYTPVFVENSDMTLQVSSYDLIPDAPESADFHIVGSESHRDYCEYVALTSLSSSSEPTFQFDYQFIEKHPTSVVSVYAANRLLTNGYNLTTEQIRQLQQTITGCPADTARYNRFVQRAKIAEMTATGNPVVDLDMVTPEGTRCQLADIVKAHEGKLLLIDFWASWCGICRASTPDIKVLYSAYDRDRFEVISVSCDEKDDAWRAAMEKDQMQWAQYCLTPEGYKQFFAKYQLIGVPYYLLVSPDGRVMANPSGVEALKTLIPQVLQ